MAIVAPAAPFSFPLREEWEDFAHSRWGLSCGEIKSLERHGAPIHTLPAKSANGERPYIIVTELDEWLARPESLRHRPGDGEGDVLQLAAADGGGHGSRGRRLRELRGESP